MVFWDEHTEQRLAKLPVQPTPCPEPLCGYPDEGEHDCPAGGPALPLSNMKVVRSPAANTAAPFLSLMRALDSFGLSAAAFRNFGEPEMMAAAEKDLADVQRLWHAVIVTRREST